MCLLQKKLTKAHKLGMQKQTVGVHANPLDTIYIAQGGQTQQKQRNLPMINQKGYVYSYDCVKASSETGRYAGRRFSSACPALAELEMGLPRYCAYDVCGTGKETSAMYMAKARSANGRHSPSQLRRNRSRRAAVTESDERPRKITDCDAFSIQHPTPNIKNKICKSSFGIRFDPT
eukprot:TRINITY_DN7882_c0_g1_i1.p2 TRINITY_DN7882_c0_g1~~TRINITY_DN7882_c0_g1_i1.p2  ORF type:complete len:202 (+),score=6.19 TRINITY_DN7882_c0_g1_i1:79-606(+)